MRSPNGRCVRPDVVAADHSRRRLLGAAAALALGPAAVVLAQPGPRVIEIVAKRFVFVPNIIHVKKGETVTLQFSTPEVPMGFNLPDFGVRADLMPLKLTTVRLTPDKAGSFTFLCDVFCGTGHEDMNGTLIVSAQDLL